MIALPVLDIKKENNRTNPGFESWRINPSELISEKQNQPIFDLTDYIQSIQGLPTKTALIGKTGDGTPLLFDLNDPKPGSIIVLGDPFTGKTQLLKNMTASLVMENSPFEVEVYVISNKPRQWDDLTKTYPEHFQVVTTNYDHKTTRTIMDVCDLTESRQNGRLNGSSVLFLFDGFETLPYMDFDIRLNFEWLIKEGPKVGVWPVVTMETHAALDHIKWVDHFRTRLIGSITDTSVSSKLTLSNVIQPQTFEIGREFSVRKGRNWLNFLIPDSIA